MLALAVAVSMVVVTLLTATTAEPPTERHRLGIITSSVVLEQQGPHYEGFVQFSVDGPTQMRLDVDTLDIWVNDKGEGVTLPPGSTPFSAKDRLTIRPDATTYSPADGRQIITISLSIPVADIDKRPLATGVRLTLRSESDTPPTDDIGLVSGALAFVYAAPPGISVDGQGFGPDIVLESLGVTSFGTPSTPGPLRSFTFVNSGPVTVFLDTENRGSLFAFTTQTMTIDRPQWWFSPETSDDPDFSYTSPESVLLPGQTRRDAADAVVQVVGASRDIDVLQQWGIYRLTGTVSFTTGNVTSEPIIYERSTYFLVFPLRQALGSLLAVTIVILFVVSLIRRRREQEITP